MNRRIVVLLLLAVLLLLPSGHAISLSHEEIQSPILYEPGAQYVFYFSVSDYSYGASLSLEGDWATYSTIQETASTQPGVVKQFSVTVSPPVQPDTPGIHTLFVGAKEERPPGSGVGATAKVRKGIHFKVLFPAKSLSAQLISPDVNTGEVSNMQVLLISETIQEITQAKATITVMDASGTIVGQVATESASLGRGEQKSLTGAFNSAGLKPATYHARALVTYDGNSTTAEDDFRVGVLEVYIVNFTRSLETGKISPYLIEIESGWNDPISNIFGEMYLNQKPVMTTPTMETLRPWERATLQGYVDTSSLPPGTYNATILVRFGDKTRANLSTVEVYEKKRAGGLFSWSSGTTTGIVVIGGIILLVLLLGVNLYLLTRRRRKEPGSGEKP